MKRISLRLPDNIHFDITASAKEHRRSINSELIVAIEIYLETLKTHAKIQESDDDENDERK